MFCTLLWIPQFVLSCFSPNTTVGIADKGPVGVSLRPLSGAHLLLLTVVVISLSKNVRATINSASTGSVLVRINRLSGASGWVNRGSGACCDVNLVPLVLGPGSSRSCWSAGGVGNGQVLQSVVGPACWSVSLASPSTWWSSSFFALRSAQPFLDIHADQCLTS